ncbi:hypothetical protein CJU90_4221 [Yarrowia sp. C11]|nr:hypothetical protein CKK34_6506 [Yarrowia sp. E02]KAG5365163.1 hypothetical protein CJU90_4221 [Yarrowia sp. C11]
MTDYDEDYYYSPGPNHNHYYMPPDNTFEYMPMGLHPGHPGPHMYPMGHHPGPVPTPGPPPGPPPHHMGQYMPQQHQRQPSYGGRYDMNMGYFVPVFEPTPEPEGDPREAKGVKENDAAKSGSEKSLSASVSEKTENQAQKLPKQENKPGQTNENVAPSTDLKPDSKSDENETQDKPSAEDDKTAAKLAQKEAARQQKMEQRQRQRDATMDYIQEVFVSKLQADSSLTINSVSIPVHSIFAARSKTLAQKLTSKAGKNGPETTLKLTVSDPGNWINEAAISSVVATLYGLPLQSQMRQAQWFGAFMVSEALGLSQVTEEIEAALKKQLVTTQATITALNSVVQRCLQGGKGGANLTVLPPVLTNQKQSRELFALFSFLLSCLGTLTQSSIVELSTSSLVKSPFALYKVIMETSELFEGNTMEKYSLAKKLVQPRQKSHPGYQDVAVLAFSSDKDGLEIRRKKV